MPVYPYAPPEYIPLAEMPEYLGMSRQNFYQSGLADWIKEEFSVYSVGRSLLMGSTRAQQIAQYLEWREKKVERGEIPANHSLVSDEGFREYLETSGHWE